MKASAGFDTLVRHPLKIGPDSRRVIILPFVHGYRLQMRDVFSYVASLSDGKVDEEVAKIRDQFAGRHENLEEVLGINYATAASITGMGERLSSARQLLLGAFFSMEYSMESAALFNPSIVRHPDQAGLRSGCVRFVMSFRATGEGHVSSAVFEAGEIDSDYTVTFYPRKRCSRPAMVSPDRFYLKHLFRRKLGEMVSNMGSADRVLQKLGDKFTVRELEAAVADVRQEQKGADRGHDQFETMLWLARSNYEVRAAAGAAVSDLIVFPHSESESRGIEDVRLVQFAGEDGSSVYYGTYTAFNGQRVLPMLLETEDFKTVRIHTLNGKCVQNKGMALFPRKVNGHYCVCSRIDGRNLFVMYSDYVHFWESAEYLAGPKFSWEYRLIGNCGSPIETPEGWLLLTHGVGPVRQYSIGAMLLDIEDPTVVRGRLKEPLLTPTGEEREGYVPNVVYSCGSMTVGNRIIIPYAASDMVSSIASVETDELIGRLLASGS